MKKYIGKERGITLVALVITIIILLILATISIQSLTSTGLFKNAKEAKEKTQNAAENQAKTLNEYEDELNKYLLDKKEENEIKLADKVKVGDYVTYEPDAISNIDERYTTLLSNMETYSGSDVNTIDTLKQEINLRWRVLDVQNGQVRLISDIPTTSTVTLSGFNGYNNAVKLLDDACSVLYTNSKLSSKVQNLKIEDMQDKMKIDYTKIDSNYGSTAIPNDKFYPSILLKEQEQKINETMGKMLNLSEQDEFINQTVKLQASSLELKSTYYKKNMVMDDFKDSKYYDLFINNGSDYSTYWLSSRCIFANSNRGYFYVRSVDPGCINAHYVINSRGDKDKGDEFSLSYGFRPVIILKSNVNVISGNGKINTPFEIK